MLVVKVHYGLGNQLFQYALARSLSVQRGIEFRLDTSFFQGPPDKAHPRVYQLNKFNIVENIARPAEVNEFIKPSFLQKRWRNLAHTVIPYYHRKVVNEARLDFDENIFKVKNDTYLLGYWQDVRYFSSVEDIVRKELSFKTDATGYNKELLDKIKNTNSVCIHLRRGDYLTDQFTVQNVGICDLPYYYKAVEKIALKVNNPVFYIFSDEIEWAEKNFHINYPTAFVKHNSQEQAFEDLRLMCNCRSHIIANSSFSWWGAWLSNNKDKIVIAPAVWRSKGPAMYLPEGWLSL